MGGATYSTESRSPPPLSTPQKHGCLFLSSGYGFLPFGGEPLPTPSRAQTVTLVSLLSYLSSGTQRAKNRGFWREAWEGNRPSSYMLPLPVTRTRQNTTSFGKPEFCVGRAIA